MDRKAGVNAASRTDPAPEERVARFEFAAGALDAFEARGFRKRFEPHFHDTAVIAAVETGAAQLVTARGTFVATAGSLITLSAGEMHAAVPLTTDGYTYRAIYPTADFMHAVGFATVDEQVRASYSFASPVNHSPDVASRLLAVHTGLMCDGPDLETECHIVETLRTLRERHQSLTAMAERAADLETVARAKRYLDIHFNERVRLATLASECRISRFHLIRMFRRVVGATPYAYLVQVRLNRARVMLLRGESLPEVAYTCGFADQSHFTRAFSGAYGLPPGKYQRLLREKRVASTSSPNATR